MNFDYPNKRETEKFKKCPESECGVMNNPQENFCTDCGAELPPDKGEDDENDAVAISELEASSDEAL